MTDLIGRTALTLPPVYTMAYRVMLLLSVVVILVGLICLCELMST